ncbi:unnamed protein product [Ambrosiozyma monospora]|uniref:Unnamed protein product n=1 Tax=Ambrosiozyma monospora TaxID=43982 RepID=A0A9W7DJH7_AMBMO|nr:unnamed protein product [Ambrosiozyma monospora]
MFSIAANREEVNRFEKTQTPKPEDKPQRREHIGGNRNSYNSRDNQHRGRYNREWDRDKDKGGSRNHRNKDYETDRDRGHGRYKYRERDDRRQTGYNKYDSHNKDTKSSYNRRDREPAQSLEQLKPTDSAWDKTPKDYEGASAARAKASGLFPVPGATVKKTLDSGEVKRILNKKKTNRAISVAQTELTPARSRNSTRLIVSEVDFEKISPQQIQKHFESFIVSSIIPNVEYEDFNLNTYLTPDKTKLIVETSKSLVATALTGLTDRTIPELDVTPHIERPHNYIVLDDQHEANPDEIVDEIIESPNLFGLQNIPFGTSREQIIEILSEFGDLESLSVILDKLSYESKGLAFFEFRELKVSPEELIDSLGKKEIDSNNLSCYRACQNTRNLYQQSIDITADTLFDFTDKKTDNITRQKPATFYL